MQAAGRSANGTNSNFQYASSYMMNQQPQQQQQQFFDQQQQQAPFPVHSISRTTSTTAQGRGMNMNSSMPGNPGAPSAMMTMSKKNEETVVKYTAAAPSPRLMASSVVETSETRSVTARTATATASMVATKTVVRGGMQPQQQHQQFIEDQQGEGDDTQDQYLHQQQQYPPPMTARPAPVANIPRLHPQRQQMQMENPVPYRPQQHQHQQQQMYDQRGYGAPKQFLDDEFSNENSNASIERRQPTTQRQVMQASANAAALVAFTPNVDPSSPPATLTTRKRPPMESTESLQDDLTGRPSNKLMVPSLFPKQPQQQLTQSLFGNQDFHSHDVERISTQLKHPLYVQDVMVRRGPGGKKLLYLSHEGAVNHANELFGWDGWSFDVLDFAENVVKVEQDKFRITVRVFGAITLKNGMFKKDFGFGSSIGTFHDAWEMSYKTASSDCQKRCLRLFGSYLGNCLYNKDFSDQLLEDKMKTNPKIL